VSTPELLAAASAALAAAAARHGAEAARLLEPYTRPVERSTP
jgi:hypothetical protein